MATSFSNAALASLPSAILSQYPVNKWLDVRCPLGQKLFLVLHLAQHANVFGFYQSLVLTIELVDLRQVRELFLQQNTRT